MARTPSSKSQSRRTTLALALVLALSSLSVAGLGLAAHAAGTPLQHACPEDEVPAAGFADTAGNTHQAAIDCIVWHGVARGTTADLYAGGGTVTRDQMASFLARTIESARDLPGPEPAGFADIDGNPHADRIRQLAGADLVRGTTATRYEPRRPVTRAQMATFLVRGFEHVTGTSLPTSSSAFPDTGGNPHEPNIAKAAEAGFTAGTSEGTFDPSASVRRDQMASFVARVLDRLAAEGLLDLVLDGLVDAPLLDPDEDSDGGSDVDPVAHGEDISLANTGPRTNDLEQSGSIRTSHDGQVIEGMRVHGNIKVMHADVTIRDVEIVYDGTQHAIYSSSSNPGETVNTRIEWTHVDARGTCDARGIVVYGWDTTVYRTSVIGGSSGGMLVNGDEWIESYSGDREDEVAAGECHGSGLSTHGADGVKVVRSNLDMGHSGSSALSLYPRVKPVTDALIEANLFNGGSYCTYGGDLKEHKESNHHIRYLGNKFGRSAHDTCGQYGPVTAWTDDRPGNEWTDNTWQDTGEAITP